MRRGRCRRRRGFRFAVDDRGGPEELVIAQVSDMGFDSFIYWPETADMTQLLRWAGEVVPAARALLPLRDSWPGRCRQPRRSVGTRTAPPDFRAGVNVVARRT